MLGTLKFMGKIQTIILFSALVTFSLFYSMQLLITTSGEVPIRVDGIKIDAVTLPVMDTRVNRETPRPELVDDPPVIPDNNISDIFDEGIIQAGPWLAASSDDVELTDFEFFGPADGNALPIARVEPDYPRREAARGIEGYVIVEFDVSETGRVIDPRILGAEPPSVFDRAAIQAVGQWKYNPRIQNGKPVKMLNLRTRFSFSLRE